MSVPGELGHDADHHELEAGGQVLEQRAGETQGGQQSLRTVTTVRYILPFTRIIVAKYEKETL